MLQMDEISDRAIHLSELIQIAETSFDKQRIEGSHEDHPSELNNVSIKSAARVVKMCMRKG